MPQLARWPSCNAKTRSPYAVDPQPTIQQTFSWHFYWAVLMESIRFDHTVFFFQQLHLVDVFHSSLVYRIFCVDRIEIVHFLQTSLIVEVVDVVGGYKDATVCLINVTLDADRIHGFIHTPQNTFLRESCRQNSGGDREYRFDCHQT